MRVAIVHDHAIHLGGAERVLLTLLKVYPQADVYLGFVIPSWMEIIRRLTKGKVKGSFFNTIPYSSRIADWFKPIMHLYWESLDLSDYDVVISSSHSFSSKSVITPPGVLHISYIYTSPRYLYAEYNEAQWMRSGLSRILLKPLLSWIRTRDFIAAQRPDVLVAISKTVQERIWKYYRRKSLLLYPPVTLPQRSVLQRRKPDYFLCVSRLVKQKGIDLAIRACNELKLPLVIVGVGPQEKHLRSLSGPTVKFLGQVADEKMGHIYKRARALLYCSRDEDFGIVPVEAMAHGVPVIGYNSGGVREAVINGKTGILFFSYSVPSLKRAIEIFLDQSWSTLVCRRQAERFSEDQFIEKIRLIIDHSSNRYEYS